MSKTLQTQLLVRVPARATKSNIKQIIHTMEVLDARADKAHLRGDFSRATQYAEFVQELDALLARVNDNSPLWKEAF